jgi:hypothetical protein
VPDQRSHRGAHPEDHRLFAAEALSALRSAAADLSWLLERGYATPSALKVTGDRYALDARQRTAVMRCACGETVRRQRQSRKLPAGGLAGHGVEIDGYNLLTTIEAALGGGVVLVGRDGCHRDMASMHGTYRTVDETRPALELIGAALGRLGVRGAKFLLDSPVSNSGRLKGVMAEVAEESNWAWDIELVTNPDAVLVRSTGIIVSADSMILDGPVRWFDLAGEIVSRDVPGAWVVDLAGCPGNPKSEIRNKFK